MQHMPIEYQKKKKVKLAINIASMDMQHVIKRNQFLQV